ncbi:9182_t:CDS:2 [Dentiscutata heterogama]|uniref:9182_t:CDS:1 n=1 Tax=Dentiscutata heterogama TaxID=1316150 RepID=A0ACA9KKX6_9GLOM|nr:9182_t:CDS:2 [Dentiscutata heterogama]
MESPMFSNEEVNNSSDFTIENINYTSFTSITSMSDSLFTFPVNNFSIIRTIDTEISLSKYLDKYLLPATLTNFSLDDLKVALFGIQSNLNNPPFISFEEYKMVSLNEIDYYFDLDSFLLTISTLSFIISPISFFIYPNKMWNLKNHNHEYYSITNPSSQKDEKIRLCNIPHFLFAQLTFFTPLKILIFFPKMFNFKKRNSFLVNNMFELWYDEIFYPALIQICSKDILHHIPTSFQSHYNLSKKITQNTYIYDSYSLDNEYLQNLVDIMRNNIRNNISKNPQLIVFEDFFFHIYAKNLKLSTKFKNIDKFKKSLNFITKNFDDSDSTWKNLAKFDLGIEFISTKNTPTSVYWKRETSINLVKKIGATLAFSSPTSGIFEWTHTYDIAGASGEASKFVQDNCRIFYVQTYHIDKEPLTASQPALFLNLTDYDAVYNSLKIQNTCKNIDQILNNSKSISFGARLEYRLSYQITEQFAKKLIEENDLNIFLQTNPFFIIPTDIICNFKNKLLNVYLNAYNRSLKKSFSPELVNYKISLYMLMKSIFHSIKTIPYSYKYFGTSNINNSNNDGTLEFFKTIHNYNIAWLPINQIQIQNCKIKITSKNFKQNFNFSLSNNNEEEEDIINIPLTPVDIVD